MEPVTRRCFVIALGTASLAPGCAWPAAAGTHATPAQRSAVINRTYTFFSGEELRFIEPACECLIPADGSLPGALDAAVPHYLDRQLSSSWGAGERLYRDGPWQPGAAGTVGPLPPRALFRRSLHAIRLELDAGSKPFHTLCSGEQQGYLVLLQSGRGDLGGVPATVFFNLLLTMTVEGFFAHPHHGRTRDRVPWRLPAFPGALARSVDCSLAWGQGLVPQA